MDRSCSDDSEIEEDRACGGAGPTGGGPEQEDRGWIRADDVYLEYWRSTHLSDDGGDTLLSSPEPRVQAGRPGAGRNKQLHIVCAQTYEYVQVCALSIRTKNQL